MSFNIMKGQLREFKAQNQEESQKKSDKAVKDNEIKEKEDDSSVKDNESDTQKVSWFADS